MSEAPRDYDHDRLVAESGPLRRRLAFDIEQGEVSRFLVQLEYADEDGEWTPVVRYDHDAVGSDEAVHDVTEEGLHIDIYRGDEKIVTEFVAPPQPANRALTFAEEHLSRNLQRFVKRFEEWESEDQ